MFVVEACSDDLDLVSYLRIEERKLEADGRNGTRASASNTRTVIAQRRGER